MGHWRDAFMEAQRALRRAPAHSLLSIALLALGIGSTTAILSVSDALLVRPLPLDDPERLIVPFASREDGWVLPSAVEIEAWRQAPSLEQVSAAEVGPVTLLGDGPAERVPAARIEASYLPLLGVTPTAGRLFDESEAQSGAPVVLLGYGLWQRRFGGRREAIGTTLRLEGRQWEIVGVLPKSFDQPLEAELWRPLDLGALPEGERTGHHLVGVARLVAGATLEGAQREMAVLSKPLETLYPETNQGWSAFAMTLRQNLLSDPRGSFRRAALVLIGGAFLLLLIATANVVQLALVRAAGRRRELETRLSIGASRASLARLLLTENLILGVVAGITSLPLSFLLARTLLSLAPISADAFASHLLTTAYDLRVLAAVVLMIVTTGFVGGAIPAMRLSKIDMTGFLSSTRSSQSSRQRRFLDFAVAIQVALAVALVVVTAVLAESYTLLRRVDTGYEPTGLAAFNFSLEKDPYEDWQSRLTFIDELLVATRSLAGISRAGITTNVPLSAQTWVTGYRCEGREYTLGEEPTVADRLVSPGYLETLGVELRSGRFFRNSDRADTEPVAIVNQALAEDCWPGQDAVGKRIKRQSRRGLQGWMTIVGVVGDTRELRKDFRQSHAAWYLPLAQHDIFRDVMLVVKSDGDPLSTSPAIRRIVAEVDPNQPLSAPQLLAEHLDFALGSDRLAALVMVYFAVMSVLLAAVGLYGSMSRYVSQRRKTFGICLAFGASGRRLLWGVVGRGLAFSALGAIAGAIASLALNHLTAAFVYGAVLGDVARIVLTVLLILGCALGACLLPAYRAARLDPSQLLRQ